MAFCTGAAHYTALWLIIGLALRATEYCYSVCHWSHYYAWCHVRIITVVLKHWASSVWFFMYEVSRAPCCILSYVSKASRTRSTAVFYTGNRNLKTSFEMALWSMLQYRRTSNVRSSDRIEVVCCKEVKCRLGLIHLMLPRCVLL